jgi:hypothetical protein
MTCHQTASDSRSSGPLAPARRSRRELVLAVMVGLALIVAGPSLCPAQTTLTLGSTYEADNLGIFEAAGSPVKNGTLSINSGGSKGNLGLGSSASHTQNGTANYNVVALSPTATSAEISALSSASQLANSLTPNGSYNSSTRIITGSGSLVVVDLSGLTRNNKDLTIQGDSSQTFVINVRGGMTLNTSSILLSGGVTANHVLFNVVGGGLTINEVSTSTLNGTFLDLAGGIILNTSAGTTTLNGSLVGEAGMTINGSTSINAGSFTDPAIAPELPTIAIAGMAFLLLMGRTGFDYLRRRRAATGPPPTGP